MTGKQFHRGQRFIVKVEQDLVFPIVAQLGVFCGPAIAFDGRPGGDPTCISVKIYNNLVGSLLSDRLISLHSLQRTHPMPIYGHIRFNYCKVSKSIWAKSSSVNVPPTVRDET